MTTDPHRWDKPIIKTPDRVLSKRDVFNYYSDPKIRAKLLSQLKDYPVLAVQSLSPDKQLYRRNVTKDIPIQITKATRNADDRNDLAWFAERRFSEFHPVIRSKTDKIWVDIDPGGSQSTEDLKPVVKKVDDVLSQVPNVSNTEIAYSGGRGYHVIGYLDKQKDTDEMRRKLNEYLRKLTRKDKELTLRPPKVDQIRLDTSTLHDTGSIRALYSLNSNTGLAAVPINKGDLDSFDPKKDADPRLLVTKTYTPKRQDREFAPGIPAQRVVQPIPEVENKHWTLAVQEHAAERAGKHWDLRLIDPNTAHAHSWALPKAKLPLPGERPLLAVQVPTHTARYALTFGAGKPKEIGKGYGKGTVELKIKEPIKVLSSTPNTVKFERDFNNENPERYLLFRTKDNSWLLRSISREKEAAMHSSSYMLGYDSVFEKLGLKNTTMSNIPLESQDEKLPAGALSKMIEELPPPPKRIAQRRKQGPPYQTRMNQPTSWNSPMEISPYMAVGPSPILGYW